MHALVAYMITVHVQHMYCTYTYMYLNDLLLFVNCEQVGHLSRIQQPIHILQERLLLDLRVGDQEHSRLALLPGSLQQCLQVLLPLGLPVALGDLGLEDVVVGHCSGEACEGLSPTAPHAHQQGVAARLLDDATDTRQVLQDIPDVQVECGRLTNPLTSCVHVIQFVESIHNT